MHCITCLSDTKKPLTKNKIYVKLQYAKILEFFKYLLYVFDFQLSINIGDIKKEDIKSFCKDEDYNFIYTDNIDKYSNLADDDLHKITRNELLEKLNDTPTLKTGFSNYFLINNDGEIQYDIFNFKKWLFSNPTNGNFEKRKAKLVSDINKKYKGYIVSEKMIKKALKELLNMGLVKKIVKSKNENWILDPVFSAGYDVIRDNQLMSEGIKSMKNYIKNIDFYKNVDESNISSVYLRYYDRVNFLNSHP